MNFFKNIIGSATSSLNYNVGERVCSIGGDAGWELYDGTRKQTEEPVSVFKFNKKSHPQHVGLAENFLKRIKTLRHPHILAYMDGLDNDAEILIVTERVTTLEQYLKTLRGNPDNNENMIKMAIAWGFHCILEALGFVDVDCKMAHGNISMESIMVTKGGDWKLGGFFITGEFEEGVGPCRLFRENPNILPAKYKSPERLQNKWSFMTPTSVDIWSLGCILFESFNGPVYSPDDFTANLSALPSQLHKTYKQMLASGPGERLDAKRLLENPGFKYLFRNSLFSTLEFLGEYQLKTDAERAPFIQKLSGLVDQFPVEVCCFKILPALREAFTYTTPGMPGGAAPQGGQKRISPLASMIVVPFLKIAAKLKDEAEFQRIIVPVLIDLFGSNDRATRVALLQKLGDFVGFIDPKVLNAKIFVSICSGFSDSTPMLRELTIKSAVVLAPKLDTKNLNEVLLRHIIQLLKDTEPPIRTNALICITKILDNFDESTQKKLVMNSFPQAIRDPFVPARITAIRGIGSAQKYIENDATSVASKILPALSCALVDPAPDVRSTAFSLMETFVAKLKIQSEKRAIDQKREEEENRKKNLETRTGKSGSVDEKMSSDGKNASSSSATTDKNNYFSKAAGLFATSWGTNSNNNSTASLSSMGSTGNNSNTSFSRATPPPAPAAAAGGAALASQSKLPKASLSLKSKTSSSNSVNLLDGFDDDNDGWGNDNDDFNNDTDGWGLGGDQEDDDKSFKSANSLSSPSKTSRGHVEVPAQMQKQLSSDEFFGSMLSDSGSTGAKLGLKSKNSSSTSSPSASPVEDRKAAAQKKREEARQRIAQRKAATAKPKVVAKKVTDGGDDWDNW